MMPSAPKSVVSQVREWAKKDPHQKGFAVGKKTDPRFKDSLPPDEFVAMLYECNGSAYLLAKKLGISHRSVALRRENIERGTNIQLPRGRVEIWKSQAHRLRIDLALETGSILCGSDLHAWPEVYGTAMAAFVDFNRRLKPQVVLLNGDGLDGAQISRHSRLGWDKRPSPADELEALTDFLEQVRRANPNARYIRTRGNHDSRLETYLSSNAPLVEGMKGTTLTDHLPGWEECMAVWVNGNECIIKHRGRHSGIHATFNEVRRLGTSFVHGHLHAQNLVQFRNAHGDKYGLDLGMLAPVEGPMFDYCELDITNWRSGFGVLSFRDGRMEVPELATVVDEEAGLVRFRGQTLTYDV